MLKKEVNLLAYEHTAWQGNATFYFFIIFYFISDFMLTIFKYFVHHTSQEHLLELWISTLSISLLH